MRYIVSGPAIGKLLQENRIRISRGELKFTPLVESVPAKKVTASDIKSPAVDTDSKEVPPIDNKEVSPEVDTKSVDVDGDSKEVKADDCKDVQAVDDKKTATAKSTKSTEKTKK